MRVNGLAALANLKEQLSGWGRAKGSEGLTCLDRLAGGYLKCSKLGIEKIVLVWPSDNDEAAEALERAAVDDLAIGNANDRTASGGGEG